MKLSSVTLKHVVYAVMAGALAAVGAWQMASGHVLVVGGVAVMSVLTTLKALEDSTGVK